MREWSAVTVVCAAMWLGAVGCGSSSPAPQQVVGASQAASAADTASCTDPWVTAAVKDVTQIAPVGAVCSPALYGNGSWGSYPDLLAKVQATMSTCGDKWVTQAFIEVVGRLPRPEECNAKLYGNGSWSSYSDLRTKITTARARPPGRAIEGTTPPVPIDTAKPSQLVRTYHLLGGSGPRLRKVLGLVSPHPQVYAVYWGQKWSVTPNLWKNLNRAVTEMSQGTYADALAQYGVGKSVSVGYWVSNDAVPGCVGSWCFWEVINEITRIQGDSKSGIPRAWTLGSGRDPVILVFVPESVVDTSGWSGYHWLARESSPNPHSNGQIPYALIKVPDRAFNGYPDGLASATETASHEYVEATTNTTPLLGWMDPSGSIFSWFTTAEPADVCGQEGQTSAKVASWSFAPYWSNQANGGNGACVP
jgi:hypothetical protein